MIKKRNFHVNLLFCYTKLYKAFSFSRAVNMFVFCFFLQSQYIWNLDTNECFLDISYHFRNINWHKRGWDWSIKQLYYHCVKREKKPTNAPRPPPPPNWSNTYSIVPFKSITITLKYHNHYQYPLRGAKYIAQSATFARAKWYNQLKWHNSLILLNLLSR